MDIRGTQTSCRLDNRTHQKEKKGPVCGKDDLRDAFALTEAIRLGSVTPVYKEQQGFVRLKSLVDVYTMTSRDTARIQNRIKALFRSRGVDASSKAIYTQKEKYDPAYETEKR